MQTMRTIGRSVLCTYFCCFLFVAGNDLELTIHRVIDASYSQVPIGVEERVGQNLTLSCDLSSSNQSVYDDNILWGKATNDFIFKNESDLEVFAKQKSPYLFNLRSSTTQSVNNGVKTFSPLQAQDTGTYFCGSLKYHKFKVVYVIVREANGSHALPTSLFHTPYRNSMNVYCNERMFKCKSSNVCIKQHYVCDRKPDCPDGSDELVETCNGDPCADKLQCDDGRCIPTSWCCDRYHDPNCTVNYRPSCCQILSDIYDDPDYYPPHNMTQRTHPNGGRYIFITLCILATFFSTLLMLLILSKIFMLAKKARYREHHLEQMFNLEDCSHQLRRTTAAGGGSFRRIAAEARGAGDALLVLSDEMLLRGTTSEQFCPAARNEDGPPSYTDCISLEPPPPYTSQDCLNRT